MTRFRRYERRRVPFSCFALPGSFSAGPRASGPVYMFCVPEPLFGPEGVRTRFQVLRSRDHFDVGTVFMFCAPGPVYDILRAPGPIFMFCVPRPIFGGTEGVGSRFYVLRSRTHFLRYRGRRVPFSCFAFQDPFSTVPTASGPVFMFCAPEPVFGSTDGVGFRFHVLRSQTQFRRDRGRRVQFHFLRS
jgi:hypothetical protein